MTTIQSLTIDAGATLSQTLTVADTTGKSYRAAIVDTRWNKVLDLTVSIASGTTVDILLTAEQTASLQVPNALAHFDRYGLMGYWDLEEIDGTTVTRVYQGQVTYSREATK